MTYERPEILNRLDNRQVRALWDRLKEKRLAFDPLTDAWLRMGWIADKCMVETQRRGIEGWT